MTSAALGFALAGALVHACWNLGVGGSRSPRPSTAVALVVAVGVGAVPSIVWWRVTTAAVPWIVASTVLELAYVALLAAAYDRSDVKVVYPVARGTAPVLVLAVAIAFGATVHVSQVIGVCTIVFGIAIVRRTRVHGPSSDLALALFISITIAAYTLIDKRGIAHANPVSYYELVLTAPAILYLAATAKTDGVAALRREVKLTTMLAGVGIFVSYVLILAALQRAPAPNVAAIRETSIVLVPLLGAAAAREWMGWRGAIGAAITAAGVMAVVLG